MFRWAIATSPTSRSEPVAKGYPDLKASANFQELQRQLAETENQLSFAPRVQF